jgi:glutaminyl-peptide cyclotransferase
VYLLIKFLARLAAACVLALVFLFGRISCAAAPGNLWDEFSGEKALAHVQHLVDLGPHPPASVAIEKARDYIESELKRSGWTVARQRFTDNTPRGKVEFVNLVATFSAHGATARPTFILCSHYDTKIFETFTFVGANDGGSSTGLLLEMGRVLALRPELAAKTELVFFDGEEAYEEFSEVDGVYGSRYFARQLVEHKQAGQFRGGILFDMVGDRSLGITLPSESPPNMARDIFSAADALNLRKFFSYFENDVTDDHTALNRAGVPTIDLIDFDYAWWHTAEDKMDKISAESIQIVGRVALRYLVDSALK